MKEFGIWLLLSIAVVAMAGCGGDNTTTFVLQSGSPTATAGASGASPSVNGSASPGTSSLPATAATAIPNNLKIIIDTPGASTAISSPVEVTGAASVDKGTVVAVVLDAAGTELGRATTTASAATPDFGHFDASVSFSGATAGSKGQIKVFGVSPRDGTTPTFYYFITIKFA